jgi:hypothetical protein
MLCTVPAHVRSGTVSYSEDLLDASGTRRG